MSTYYIGCLVRQQASHSKHDRPSATGAAGRWVGSQRGVGRSRKSEAVPLQKAQFHPLVCTPSPSESPGPPGLPRSSAHRCGPGPHPWPSSCQDRFLSDTLPPVHTRRTYHCRDHLCPHCFLRLDLAVSLFHRSGPRQLRASWPSSINPGSSLNGP